MLSDSEAKMQYRQDIPAWQKKMRKFLERWAAGRRSPVTEKRKKTDHIVKKMSPQIKQNLDVQARLAVLGMLRDKRNFCEALLLADGDQGTIEDAQRKKAVIDYIDALSEEIEESAKALFEGRQTKRDHK